MALKVVEPLDEEQWNQVVAALERGPTNEQKEMIEEAIASANKLNIIRD